MKTKIETVMTDVCDDNDMLINDVLMYLIQRNFAILDMSYDQPNERYIINMIRPRDLNQYENDNVDNKNIYKKFVAYVTEIVSIKRNCRAFTPTQNVTCPRVELYLF